MSRGRRPSAAAPSPSKAMAASGRWSTNSTSAPRGREHPGGHQVGVGHAERVAEEQLLQALGRVGRERQQRPEPHQPGDHHAGGRLRADARIARATPISTAATATPPDGAEQERGAGQGGEHQAREQSVGERLGGVAEPLDHHPEAEPAAHRPEQRHLEQRAPVDAGAQRVEQRVQEVHGQWWWCWTVTMRSRPASSSTISSCP